MAIVESAKSNNPIHACRYNERLILHLLRIHKRESKANLARLSGLTAAAIGGIVSNLETKGLVVQVGKLQGDMGQPATLYSLEPSGVFGVGISLNRGHIETVLINFVGEIVAGKKHTFILPEPNKVLEIVQSDIAELTANFSVEERSRIAGIGVALPYHLGSWESPNDSWQQWEGFDFGPVLERQSGLNVVVENDGNMAALAELIYGLGLKDKEFTYLFFGPAMVKSLGGGVILNGEVRRGHTGNAGDLGLIRVPAPSYRSEAGSPWCQLTDRSSLFSLVEYLTDCGLRVSSREELNEVIAVHPDKLNVWMNDCVAALENAVCSMQAVLDMSCVVFDCEDEDRELVKEVADMLDEKLLAASKTSQPMPRVVMGSFASDAAAVGAATMPLDEAFSLREN